MSLSDGDGVNVELADGALIIIPLAIAAGALHSLGNTVAWTFFSVAVASIFIALTHTLTVIREVRR